MKLNVEKREAFWFIELTDGSRLMTLALDSDKIKALDEARRKLAHHQTAMVDAHLLIDREERTIMNFGSHKSSEGNARALIHCSVNLTPARGSGDQLTNLRHPDEPSRRSVTAASLPL